MQRYLFSILVIGTFASGSPYAGPATDTDGDGVPDTVDVCPETPDGIGVDADGRPLGDIDGDCDTDLSDFALFQQGFSGGLAFDVVGTWDVFYQDPVYGAPSYWATLTFYRNGVVQLTNRAALPCFLLYSLHGSSAAIHFVPTGSCSLFCVSYNTTVVLEFQYQSVNEMRNDETTGAACALGVMHLRAYRRF